MKPRPLFYHILFPFLAVSLLVLLAVTLIALTGLRAHYMRATEADLFARAALIQPALMSLGDRAAVQALCSDLGKASGTRITIIGEDGWVMGDSHENTVTMDNHGSRPEILAARQHGRGMEIRFSDTLKENMMYLALRIDAPEGFASGIGCLRLSLPLDEIDAAIASLGLRIAGGAVALGIFAALICILITRRITHPLERMTRQAELVSRGDFSQRLTTPGSRELSLLATTLNDMSQKLDDTVGSLTQHQQQLESVFRNMVEGVLVLDSEERVQNVNKRARLLLGLDKQGAIGRPVREVIRNPELIGFIDQLPGPGASAEQSLIIRGDIEVHLRAYGTRLDLSESALGTLIVLYDVTQIRRLEAMRRDFVANVSHELKTPTTSIIGFVETLSDGALERPDDARHFLNIINRQARRLNAIIEDLLSLARIEGEYRLEEADKSMVVLEPFIDNVIAECRPRAEKRGIRIVQEGSGSLEAPLDRELMEQALLNLINNAIKYSRKAAEVRIGVETRDGECLIRVADEGEGIPEEHLPRLFERFYRVDTARSREEGGTGLGLAIVKHIAQVHGGRATVESAVGQGSCFTLHLPLH